MDLPVIMEFSYVSLQQIHDDVVKGISKLHFVGFEWDSY